MKLVKGLRILYVRLAQQGLGVTLLWAADHAARIVTGANLRRVSQITPHLHVGGQYRRRGWKRLQRRGVTAVVNLREEYDDRAKGVAPERYLHLPTPDDGAPRIEELRTAAAFIADEVARGGGVWVHCGSGIGRAPTTAAAYLITTGQTAEQAWSQIREIRPFIRPTPPQIGQIERFEKER